MGADGSLNHDAFLAAHPDLAAHASTIRNYKTIEALAKGLGDTKSLVGRKLESVETVLNPAADDVTGQALRRSVLGIPDEGTPQAYEYQAPEGAQIDNQLLGDFAKKAHELGISKAQFGELVNYQLGVMQQGSEAVQQQIAQADAQAKTQFWQDVEKAFGGKEQADKGLDLTVRLLRSAGLTDAEIGEQIAPTLHHAGAPLIKALAKIASHAGEDKLPSSGGVTGGSVSAKEAYRAIIHDKSNPDYEAYHNPNHASHGEVRAKVQKLIQAASKR